MQNSWQTSCTDALTAEISRALVLIADPQTLGQIRRTLHKEVKDRLISEIGKTLTNASITDIQKALT